MKLKKKKFRLRQNKRLAKHERDRKKERKLGKKTGVNSEEWTTRKDNIVTRVRNKEITAHYKALEKKQKKMSPQPESNR